MSQRNTLLSYLANYFLEMTDNLLAIVQQDRVVEANPSFLKTLKMTSDEVRQMPLVKVTDNTPIVQKTLAQQKKVEIPLIWTTKDGEKIDTITRFTPILVNKEKSFLIEAISQKPFVEMTKKCAVLEKRNAELSPIDTRTGLPSMILFSDRTEQAFLRALRDARGVLSDVRLFVFVVLAKIKEWEKFNDAQRNIIITTLISRFKSSIRSVDTFMMNEDHSFCFLFENIKNKDDIHTIIKRLNDCVNIPISHKKEKISVGLDFGYASYPENGASASALIYSAQLKLNQ